MTDLKISFEELRTIITQTIKKIDGYNLREIDSYDVFYEEQNSLHEFLTDSSELLYESMYKTTNIVEDNIRSVYILSNDATLEGHATELETQLAQLRVTGDAIASLPTEFNDSITDQILKYTDSQHTLINSSSKTTTANEKIEIEAHKRALQKLILFQGGSRIMVDLLRTFRETCIKLMSILAITLGRWESKLEDRVDAETFSEAMIMSNYEGIEKLSMKNKKSKRSNNDIYM